MKPNWVNKWTNTVLLMNPPPPPPPPTHTHTHTRAYGYLEENTVIGRKPCTQCHRERTKQLFILKILFRYIGFNFGGILCFFGSLSSPAFQFFPQVCSTVRVTATNTVHRSFNSVKECFRSWRQLSLPASILPSKFLNSVSSACAHLTLVLYLEEVMPNIMHPDGSTKNNATIRYLCADFPLLPLTMHQPRHLSTDNSKLPQNSTNTCSTDCTKARWAVFFWILHQEEKTISVWW